MRDHLNDALPIYFTDILNLYILPYIMGPYHGDICITSSMARITMSSEIYNTKYVSKKGKKNTYIIKII